MILHHIVSYHFMYSYDVVLIHIISCFNIILWHFMLCYIIWCYYINSFYYILSYILVQFCWILPVWRQSRLCELMAILVDCLRIWKSQWRPGRPLQWWKEQLHNDDHWQFDLVLWRCLKLVASHHDSWLFNISIILFVIFVAFLKNVSGNVSYTAYTVGSPYSLYSLASRHDEHHCKHLSDCHGPPVGCTARWDESHGYCRNTRPIGSISKPHNPQTGPTAHC